MLIDSNILYPFLLSSLIMPASHRCLRTERLRHLLMKTLSSTTRHCFPHMTGGKLGSKVTCSYTGQVAKVRFFIVVICFFLFLFYFII